MIWRLSLRLVVVDNGNGEVPQGLAQIGLRVEDAVEKGAMNIRPITLRSAKTRRISPITMLRHS